MWHPVLVEQILAQQAVLVEQVREDAITAPQYIPAVCPECDGKSPETCGFCGEDEE